jgi:hypothetical protein
LRSFPRPLSLEAAPAGDDPDIRDIGYYAPSGDLVLYYGDVSYWKGIVRIRRFDTTMELVEHQDDNFKSPSNARHRPCGERGGAVTHRNPGD